MEVNFLIIVLRVIDGANGIYFDRITKEPHAFSEKQPESYKDNEFVANFTHLIIHHIIPSSLPSLFVTKHGPTV